MCVSVSLHFSSAVRNDLRCSLKPVHCFCYGIFILFIFFPTGDFKRITVKKKKKLLSLFRVSDKTNGAEIDYTFELYLRIICILIFAFIME